MCGGKGSGGHAVSLAEASGVHNINNHVVPGKPSEESAMASRAVGVFSSISRSSDCVPQKAAVVAKDGSVTRLPAGASFGCLCRGRSLLQTHTVEGAREGGQAAANYRHMSGYRGPDWPCILLRLLYFPTGALQWRLVAGVGLEMHCTAGMAS